MKTLVVSILASGAQASLDGGKVGELLQYFESNQQRYKVNVEQYCRFGDLPVMELTDYKCLNVIEESLTDGKVCEFACKNDESVTGSVECICDNVQGAVAENSNCKWKFPSYSSQCGVIRMTEVDGKLADLAADANVLEAQISGVDVQMANLQSYIDEARESVADVSAKVDSKNSATLLKISEEAVAQNTARAALQAQLDTDVADLKAADIALATIVTNNGNTVGDIVSLTDDHSEQLMVQKQNITSIMQTLASQTIDIMSLETELDQETGNLLTSLNNQILKQETDRATMQDEITDNLNHLSAQDDILNAAILTAKNDLTDEVARGQVRDERLAAHDGEFEEVQNDIQSNNNLILLTQQELNAKFNFLANYTDHSVSAMGQHLTADMNTLEEAQNSANDALAAVDAALAVSINQTQSALDAEEARGDAQDATLMTHANMLVDLATDIATNVDGINTVQQNLDHAVEVQDAQLAATEAILQGNIDALEGQVKLADQSLQSNIDTTNVNLENTNEALQAERERGMVRDLRLGGHDGDISDLNDDIDEIHHELEHTMEALMTNDTRLEVKIDANHASISETVDNLADELRAMDQVLNQTDIEIKAALAATDAGLAAEVARGQGRDETLQAHHNRLVLAEADLVDKQEQIDDLTDEVEANHAEAMKTIEDTKHELEHDMEDLEKALKAVDAALMAEDVELNHRIDHTNDDLAIEKGRNDGHDKTLEMHAATLDDHGKKLHEADKAIKLVQHNLDNAVEAIGETIDDTKAALEDDIQDLEHAMNHADDELTKETVRLQSELDNTNENLGEEKTKGENRDGRLNDHNVRLTVLRKDADANTAAIADTNTVLEAKTKKLTDDLRNSTHKLSDQLYATDRRLTLEDTNLKNEDLKIRASMVVQKYNLEQKIDEDVRNSDSAIRQHFTNENFRMDNKFTNSINALAAKEQQDIDDIHAALDFFWGIYRPSRIVLLDGIFQPEVGHLLTVVPHLYRVWQMEVDIMPYKKNHYSWVNLLHFTASGDNYGRPGDRMPLVSFYPGENILHIACYINNEVSYAYDSDYILPLNRWTKLTIGQAFVQEQYVYYVKINDKQVYSVINHYPMDFNNLMVYASDPWSERPNAKLRNLILTTSWGGSIISRLDPLGDYGNHFDRSISNGTAPVDGAQPEE